MMSQTINMMCEGGERESRSIEGGLAGREAFGLPSQGMEFFLNKEL
jgi:hypothetical protein